MQTKLRFWQQLPKLLLTDIARYIAMPLHLTSLPIFIYPSHTWQWHAVEI